MVIRMDWRSSISEHTPLNNRMVRRIWWRCCYRRTPSLNRIRQAIRIHWRCSITNRICWRCPIIIRICRCSLIIRWMEQWSPIDNRMDWIIKWMDHRSPLSWRIIIRWIRRILIRRILIRWILIRWMDLWTSLDNWLVTFRLSYLISLILTRSYWVINHITSH